MRISTETIGFFKFKMALSNPISAATFYGEPKIFLKAKSTVGLIPRIMGESQKEKNDTRYITATAQVLIEGHRQDRRSALQVEKSQPGSLCDDHAARPPPEAEDEAANA